MSQIKSALNKNNNSQTQAHKGIADLVIDKSDLFIDELNNIKFAISRCQNVKDDKKNRVYVQERN